MGNATASARAASRPSARGNGRESITPGLENLKADLGGQGHADRGAGRNGRRANGRRRLPREPPAAYASPNASGKPISTSRTAVKAGDGPVASVRPEA